MSKHKKTSQKRYTLYLDESTTFKYNPYTHARENEHFCIAGIIVLDDEYSSLEQDLNCLKRAVWSEYEHPENIILHQMNISKAEDGRLDVNKYPEYAKFSANTNRKFFYNELKKVYTNGRYTIIGGSVDKTNLYNNYSIIGKNESDEYLVCLQLLLENYCHFLCINNGMGKIVYESREEKADERLRDKFYHIKLMGSMYINKSTTEKRLLGMELVNKQANCAGLQLADFIPNSFARDHTGLSQARYNIFGTLKYFQYDGHVCDKNKFGVKYML